MISYTIRRLVQSLIVLVLVTVLVFVVMHLLPGDPLLLYFSQSNLNEIPVKQLEAVRSEFGLDKPIPIQYINWIAGIFHGDFGTSIFFREHVTDLIGERLPVTIHLGILSFLLSSILGISAGVISAVRRNTWIDNVVTILANIGITMPVFWLGILLIYFFALKLHLLPVSGYTSPFDNFWLGTRQVIMPVVCITLFPLAALARQARSSMLEVIRQDYIRTAWSKGLNEQTIVLRHALKNAFISVVTMLGIQVRYIFAGVVLVETVFNIPGMGRLMVESISSKDYQVVQMCFLITAIVVLLSNLVVDISYGWFDPRIRYD